MTTRTTLQWLLVWSKDRDNVHLSSSGGRARPAGVCVRTPGWHHAFTPGGLESGRVDVGNLTPPDGARVTKVVRESKGMSAALDTAREGCPRIPAGG